MNLCKTSKPLNENAKQFTPALFQKTPRLKFGQDSGSELYRLNTQKSVTDSLNKGILKVHQERIYNPSKEYTYTTRRHLKIS